MSKILEKEINELKSVGVTFADLTADEIERVVKACERMSRPFSSVNADAVGFPVKVGGTMELFKLTIGATCWLDEFAGKWWSVDSKRYFWAMVYAMAHARDPEAFLKLTDETVATAAIREMALGASVTEGELMTAIDAVLGDQRETSGNAPTRAPTQPDWASIVQELETATGLPCDVWVWRRSLDWVIGCYATHHNYIRAVRGERAVRMKDDLDRATNALARVRCDILKRVKGANQ